jgi:hypothetical protein
MEVKKEYSPDSPTGESSSSAEKNEDSDVHISSAEDEEKFESGQMSHQQAMVQFKDALAEIVVVGCRLFTSVIASVVSLVAEY